MYDATVAKALLRVFLSSPGDVAEERALAELVFQRLEREHADTLDINLTLWEHEPLLAHAGFQEQIDRPSKCDLVITILWARLGTRLPADFAPRAGAQPPTGTEFEIEDALQGFRLHGRPELLIYRKLARPQVDIASADAEERLRQFRELEAFCQRTFYDAAGAVRVAHHGFTDGFDFERRLQEHVRRWLERWLGPDASRSRRMQGSPFRGLQSFLEEHHDIFFGRAQAVSELIHRMGEVEAKSPADETLARLLLIQGMSGSGKTSLVRAGLLPLLALRPIEGIALWLPITLRPSAVDGEQPDAGPLGALAEAFLRTVPAARQLGASAVRLAVELRANPEAAAARMETYLAAEAAERGAPSDRVRFVVYVDQLEEAFSALSPDDAESFFAALVAVAGSSNAWVVATIRSDFAHRLEVFPRLIELMRGAGPYTLLPPRGDELAEMIREPAAAAGLRFEVRDGVSLDREILNDAIDNPESLPLLEYALEQLYQLREGATLEWDVYRPPDGSGGGLRGALIAVADSIIAETGGAGASFRRVMRELTTLSEEGTATRRYAPLTAFVSGSSERTLLDRLIEQRLCVTDRRGQEPVVYFAHEALLQSWPLSQEWLKEEAALLRDRDELQHDAQHWKKLGESDYLLGTAPEKLAAIAKVETAGMLSRGVLQEYATRSRRRARRNRVLKETVVAGICALALVCIAAGLMAMKQRNLARSQAVAADRVSNFMVSLFQFADPTGNQGNKVTVREVLDRGARDIGQGLDREPGIQAELLTAMGEAYTGLGLYDPAHKLLTRAEADQEPLSVQPDSRVRTLIALGTERYLAADYDGAKAQLQQAVKIAQTDLPGDSALTSEARDGLADVLVQLEQYSAAEQLCEAALRVDRTRGKDAMPILARTLSTLANAYYFEGKLNAAEPAMREALALRKQSLGLRSAFTAESMNDLASLLYQEGRYAAAAAQLQEALPVYREVYGPEHPELATVLNNLGRSALMAGRVDDAIPLLEQALTMSEKLKGPTHDDLVLTLNSLGMAYLYKGDTAHATTDINRALQIGRLRNHWVLDQVVLNAADLQLSLRQPRGASPLLDEAQRLLKARYPLAKNPDDQWRYAAWDAVNASLLAQENRTGDARNALARARQILVRRFGPRGFYVLRLDQREAALSLTVVATRARQ
jgi:tetratricopeptide (TPR) repeat protein